MVTYSEPTVIQLEGITRKNLIKRFLRDTGLGAYGTATGGSTTTIIDTSRLLSSQLTANEWIGGWARCSFDAGGAAAAPETEINPISNYAPSTGTVTIDTGTIYASGDGYELWKIDPQIVLDYIDQVLQEDIYLPYWSMLSFIPDFDMEQDNVTDWTDSGATSTKVTTASFGNGKRYLNISPASANDYTQSKAIRVKAGDTYHLEALVGIAAAGQTVTLALYTAAGVLIDSVSHDKLYPVRLWKDIAIPASIDSVVIRIIADVTTDDVMADDIVFHSLTTDVIPLPWWVKNSSQVKGIIKVLVTELDSNTRAPYIAGPLIQGFNIIDEAFGSGQLALYRRSGIRPPIAIFGTRNETAYSNDNTELKKVNQNFIIACVAWRVFGSLKQRPNVGLVDSAWITQQYNDWEKEYLIQQRKQLVEVTKLFTNQEHWAEYL